MKISKINILTILLGGFLIIGVLLLTGHPGVAIKTLNYLFFALLILIVFKYINNE